jgi:putative transcriptional regulator
MSKTKPRNRINRNDVESDILATARGLAEALHRVGAVDDLTMRDLDQICLPPRPEYSASEVKRIRSATRMSQPLFARLLGVDKSAVVQWERGAKRPSGPALRLLEVLDPDHNESPVVRVRRNIIGDAA